LIQFVFFHLAADIYTGGMTPNISLE